MTVSSTTNRWAYAGDGTTAAFAYTNRVFAATDLRVYAGGALQTPGSDYTVTGVNAPSGGSVIFAAAPAAGVPVILVRDVPAIQGLDYAALGPFPAESTETALDRLTVLAQQNASRIGRVLRQPDSDAGDIGELPPAAARAGQAFVFDGDGNPASGGTAFPAATDAAHLPRVNAAGTGYELRSPAQTRTDIGAEPAGTAAAAIAAHAAAGDPHPDYAQESALGNLAARNDTDVIDFASGIRIGGGATLAVYEEGTFTPTLIGSTTPGVQTYTSSTYGRYTRIGNQVFVQGRVTISAKDGAMAGDIRIGGLPFTSHNVAGFASQSLSIGLTSDITLTAGYTFLGLVIGNNGTTISMVEVGSGVVRNPVPVANIGANTDIVFGGCYRIADA